MKLITRGFGENQRIITRGFGESVIIVCYRAYTNLKSKINKNLHFWSRIK